MPQKNIILLKIRFNSKSKQKDTQPIKVFCQKPYAIDESIKINENKNHKKNINP